GKFFCATFFWQSSQKWYSSSQQQLTPTSQPQLFEFVPKPKNFTMDPEVEKIVKHNLDIFALQTAKTNYSLIL
ncbi:hypothetical protein TNIN_123381, partial [Trichonephila inaurata madagascariensis]